MVGPDDIRTLLPGADLVISAIDEPDEVDLWVNEACVGAGIPFIRGGLSYTQGLYWLVDPGRSACRQCLETYPGPTLAEDIDLPAAHVGARAPDGARQPRDRARRSAARGPVAMEALRYLTGKSCRRLRPAHTSSSISPVAARPRSEPWPRDPSCDVCATAPPKRSTSTPRSHLSVDGGVTASNDNPSEHAGLAGSATLAVRPLSIVPEGDEFIVGQRGAVGLRRAPGHRRAGACPAATGPQTIDDAAEQARRAAGEEIDVAAFEVVAPSSGSRAAPTKPRSRPAPPRRRAVPPHHGPAPPRRRPDRPPRRRRAPSRRGCAAPSRRPPGWPTPPARSASSRCTRSTPTSSLAPSDVFFLDTPVRSIAALTLLTYVLALRARGLPLAGRAGRGRPGADLDRPPAVLPRARDRPLRPLEPAPPSALRPATRRDGVRRGRARRRAPRPPRRRRRLVGAARRPEARARRDRLRRGHGDRVAVLDLPAHRPLRRAHHRDRLRQPAAGQRAHAAPRPAPHHARAARRARRRGARATSPSHAPIAGSTWSA